MGCLYISVVKREGDSQQKYQHTLFGEGGTPSSSDLGATRVCVCVCVPIPITGLPGHGYPKKKCAKGSDVMCES